MKTRLLIITSTVFALCFVGTAFATHDPTYNHSVPFGLLESNYQFIDFSYMNTVGDHIQFTLEKTRDSNCDSYNAEITDEDGNFVWGGGADVSCDSNSISNHVLHQTKIGYNEDHSIIINTPGKYYLEIEFNNLFIKREFVVKPKSSVSYDRTVYPTPWEDRSPLKQFKDGIDSKMIHCNDNLILIQKYDGSPACVKSESISKLIERGWATEPELKLISKSFAIFYAVEERGWTEEDFTTYDSHAILLKIKNDDFAFEVELDTLKEKELYMNRFNEYDEGQYIWLVSLTENKEYEYHVDAITGKILLAARDGNVMEN